jgi:hypothetical protein
MAIEQWHLRVDDDELVAGLRHEMARESATRTGMVLVLLREALATRRMMRYRAAYLAYLGKQMDVPEDVYRELTVVPLEAADDAVDNQACGGEGTPL